MNVRAIHWHLAFLAASLSLGAICLRPASSNGQEPSPTDWPRWNGVSDSRPAQWPSQSEKDLSLRQVAHVQESEESSNSSRFSGPTHVEELVQYALANNPEVQAARYHARALGARVPQARSLPDPQLMTTVFLESIQTAAGPQEVALSLSQKLPWFGKLAFRSQAAYHDAMAAYARASAVELNVVERVKRAYFDVFFLQNAAHETLRLQPRLEDVIAIARTKYETSVPGAGLESVLQAEIELSKLKTRLVGLEQAKTEAQARLVGVLHLEPHTPIEPVRELDRSNLAHTAKLLVDLAEASQPELDARRREVSRDRSAIAVAEREYWPDVTLGLSWYSIRSEGISPVANGRDAYAVGVGVNLPLYRQRLDATVREARCRTASSNRRYAAARDQVRAEVEVLYARFTEHHRVLEILESEILPRAEQGFELSTEAYRTGRQDFQQLVDSYRTLLDYRIDFHRRVAMREQAIASLERAVGCSITASMADGLREPDATSRRHPRLP